MVRALAAACHPGPTVAVTLLAVLLGAGVGLDGALVALLGTAVLTGQLSVGWSNDAVDLDRDAHTGRTDKPAATGRVGRRTLWVAAAVTGVASVVVSLLLGPRAGLAHLLLPAAGWAYNLGLKGTWWSAATYAVGFAGLPAAAYLALPDSPAPPLWAPLTGALLGVAAHVANVLPDLADDATTGVRGLPHRLGARASTLLMAAVLVAAAVATVMGPAGPPSAVLLAGGGVAVAGAGIAAVLAWRRPNSASAFRTVVAVALLDVVLLVAAT